MQVSLEGQDETFYRKLFLTLSQSLDSLEKQIQELAPFIRIRDAKNEAQKQYDQLTDLNGIEQRTLQSMEKNVTLLNQYLDQATEKLLESKELEKEYDLIMTSSSSFLLSNFASLRTLWGV